MGILHVSKGILSAFEWLEVPCSTGEKPLRKQMGRNLDISRHGGWISVDLFPKGCVPQCRHIKNNYRLLWDVRWTVIWFYDPNNMIISFETKLP